MDFLHQAELSSNLLVVLSGPSGGGKTTVCQRVMALDSRLARVVTCTTRQPRVGETPGEDYHFLDEEAFESRVAAGEFLEHASVHGARYGTRKHDVLELMRSGCDVLLNIDVQGASTVRLRAAEDALLGKALVTVFFVPSSLAELEDRLRRRGTEDEGSLRRRLSIARTEIDRWAEFDYLLMSGKREEDVRRLMALLDAERMRTVRCPAPWSEADEH